MQCAMIRVFFCAGNYLRQLFFRSKILLKSRRFQDSKIPGFQDSKILNSMFYSLPIAITCSNNIIQHIFQHML